jgi:hypothetical protein
MTILFIVAACSSAEAGSAGDCVKAASSYAVTIAACSTAVACWVLDPATLGLGTWACIAATLACLGSIPMDATYGSACMEWLDEQARLTCEAEGGFAIWDAYSQTYICEPQFSGDPPGWNTIEQQIASGDGGSGGGWWGGGWGYTPGGTVQLWCCYTIGTTRICNPC